LLREQMTNFDDCNSKLWEKSQIGY
jgi:hypothetical protein